MRRIIGGLAALLLLGACSASDEPVAEDRATCAELAEDAVEISQGEDIQLLKVREPKVDLDKQETGWEKPTGTDEVLILRCQGTGVWSDGGNQGVRLELKVDADGDAFVFYQQTA